MAKVIWSLFFLALLAVASIWTAASAAVVPLRLQAHNQRSSSGTRSTLMWLDRPSGPYNCQPNASFAPCINASNSWVIANGVVGTDASWHWNTTTRVLSSTGLYWPFSAIGSNPLGSVVLGDRVVDLTIDVPNQVTTAASYICTEGTFLVGVGANGCGGWSNGLNGTSDSSVAYNVGGDPYCVIRTLAGDDLATGLVRGVRNSFGVVGCDDTGGAYVQYTLLQDNLSTGGTLILSNGICIGAPGSQTEPQVYAPCSNANWMTFVRGPDAVDDGPVQVAAGAPVDIPVMGNDVIPNPSDPNNPTIRYTDPVTVAVTTAPAHGTAVVNDAGPQAQAGVFITYTFTDAPGSATLDTFVYTVTDGDGFTRDTGTVTLNVSNDDFRTIVHNPLNPPEDIPVGQNDIGLVPAPTDPVTDTIISPPDHGGTVTLVGSPGPATGVVAHYTPAWTVGTPTYTEHFTYRITGANGVTDDAVVSITVTNDVPEATDETITIETKGESPFLSDAGFKSGIVGIQSSNLGDSGTVAITTQGTRGTAVFDPATNQFTYVIQDRTFFVGTDTVTYTITDADGETATGTITVDIPDATVDPDHHNGGTFDDTQFFSHQILVPDRALPQILDDSPADACVVATDPSTSTCPPGSEPTAVPYNPAYCLPDAPQRGHSYCPLLINATEGRTTTPTPLPIVAGNGDLTQHTTAVVTDGAHGHCVVTGTSITYTPDAGFTGDDQCTVSVTDADVDDGDPLTTVDAPDTDTGVVYITVAAGGAGGGGGGGGLSGGGGALDFLTLSLLAAAAGLRRRLRRLNPQLMARAAGMAAAFLAALGANFALPRTATAQEVAEIVVTARKQGEEKLKEVPVAITAFDSAAIESANIQSLSDVAALTPGLSFFQAFGENLPTPVIRGIVPQDIFGKNAAAVFVDNVYVSGRSGLNFSQLDIERIEVVKGPQSALYGRNAFSGAINYVTKAPSKVFEAKSDVEAGNYGKQRIMAQISGPILGESLTGRVSGLYDYWDGSYDNTLSDDAHIGGYRYRSIQGKLRWEPVDSLKVDGGLYYSNDEIDEPPTAGGRANCEDQVEQKDSNRDQEPDPRLQNWCGPMVDLDQMPDMVVPDPNGDVNDDPWLIVPGSTTNDSMPKNKLAQGENRNVTRGTFSIQWDPGFGTFGFLTGYTLTEHSSASDFERSMGETVPFLYCANGSTGGPPPLCTAPIGDPTNLPFRLIPMGFYNLNNGDTAEEFSQEIRFTSPADQRLRYSLGGYYFNETETDYRGAIIPTTPFPQPFNVAGNGVNVPGPVPTGTALDIGGYIFGATLTPDGGLDPLNRPTGKTDTSSWSAFGSFDLDLDADAKWQLRGELRYTVEEQTGFTYQYKRCAADDVATFPAHQTNYFPFNSPPVDVCGDDIYDLRPTDASLGTFLGSCLPGRSPLTQGLLNDGSCTPGAITGSLTERFYTGRIGLKYQMNPDWMAYTSVAWGEKPGGLQFVTANVVFPDGSLVSESIINPFDSEQITAYELGIKGFTADRRIGIDLSTYYNDWTSIILRQLTQNSPASGLPYQNPVGLNVNSGDARVWGWEMTTDIAITDNLTGRLTGAWTDSQLKNARMDTFSLFPTYYTDDPSCTPEAIQAIPDPTPEDLSNNVNEAQDTKAVECQKLSGDVSGNTQMRQPEWTASASLSYKHQLTGDWNWYARADGNYIGKIFIGNDNLGWLKPRTNVNMRFGVEAPRYTLEFWVRNLFNDDNAIAAFRDIFWTNNDDIQNQNRFAGGAAETAARRSNFDDFPPWRLSVSYPNLRTFGLVAKVRFGGAER